MDAQRMRETFSVGITADEGNSKAEATSSRSRDNEIQQRRRAELIACLIFISIIAGLVLYICFGLKAEKLDSDCQGTHSVSMPSGLPPRLATTPTLQLVYKECGGIVYVPRNRTVYIAYKNGSEYAGNERCLWVISSEAKQVILKFRVQNLEKSIDYKRDGFIIAQMDTSSQELRCTKWKKNDYKELQYLSVPSFLHFTSHEAYHYHYVDMERRGFLLSLTAVERSVNTMDHRAWPSVSLVTSRKRGLMKLLDFETMNFPAETIVGGPMYQSSFGVFPTSSDHGVSRRNFTCVGFFASDNVTEHSCCNFVDGYEIKKYHDGEACVHAPGLSHGNHSVITEQSFIVFRWPQSDGNTRPCQVGWIE